MVKPLRGLDLHELRRHVAALRAEGTRELRECGTLEKVFGAPDDE